MVLVVTVAVLLFPRIEAGREEEGECMVDVVVLMDVRRLVGRLKLGLGDAIDMMAGLNWIGQTVLMLVLLKGLKRCICC
jgi:hypothetical protein